MSFCQLPHLHLLPFEWRWEVAFWTAERRRYFRWLIGAISCVHFLENIVHIMLRGLNTFVCTKVVVHDRGLARKQKKQNFSLSRFQSHTEGTE